MAEIMQSKVDQRSTTALERSVGIWGRDDRPMVAVIIAVFNDVDNIANSIRSGLSQTLHGTEVIVVDDCSTDGSYEKALDMAEKEPRLRVFQTSTNSGGAGAPRNIGIAQASSPYLMFLDSDDVLERHAAYNLLTTAERTSSELVMGKTRRFEVSKKKYLGWHHKLYRTEQHYSSIEDNPELAIDTNSVAKLYKTSFLREKNISFPENIHYEDLVFTAEIFAAVREIHVIPECVYQWNIYPTAVRKSITNQRDDIKNLQFRKTAIRTLLDIVETYDAPSLKNRLYVKIIRHDVRVYLNDMADGLDDAVCIEILGELDELIRLVPMETYEDISTPDRLMTAAALSGDVNLVRSIIPTVRGNHDLIGDWEVAGNDYLWEPQVFKKYEPDTLEQFLSTFPRHEIDDIPWFNFKWLNRVTEIDIDADNVLSVGGVLVDSFNKLSAIPNLQAHVEIRERWGAERSSVSVVQLKDTASGNVEWRFTSELTDHVDFDEMPKMSLRLHLTDGNSTSVQPFVVEKKSVSLQSKTSPRRLLNQMANIRYQPYRTVNGTLALRPARTSRKRRAVRRLLSPVTTRISRRLNANRRELDVQEQQECRKRLISQNPSIDDHLVLVESHMGQSCFDSPRAIADELQRTRPDLTIVWSARARERWAIGRTDVVVRNSEDYFDILSRAKYIIDNQSLPDGYVKREGQVYVQTWHGIPIKRMGFDEDRFAFASKDEVSNLKRKVGYWDYLTIPSEYFKKTFVPAYQYDGKFLPVGSPRNDCLVSPGTPRSEAKRVIGLNTENFTVLYAPTFRERGQAELELDLYQWVESVPDDWQLLLRPHYLNRIRVPRDLRHRIVDVSEVGDTASLLLAADMLVSDYSSIIFDYLTLDRPVVLYAYDLADYMSSARGTYFDLRQESPGPIVETQDELVEAIRGLLIADSHAERRREFRNRFAGSEPGDAARTTVNAVWGGNDEAL